MPATTSDAPDLFTPLRLGKLELPNRIVLAPLTRNRAGPGNVPQAINTTYYVQRASAGLIITEASQISPQGVGYPATPGIRDRRGLSEHPRHPLRGAGKGLEITQRGGTRGWRAHLPAAVARGTDFSSVSAAGQRAAGGAVGDPPAR